MLRALSLERAAAPAALCTGVSTASSCCFAGRKICARSCCTQMNQRADGLSPSGAPSEVSVKQLRELHIRLNLPDKA